MSNPSFDAGDSGNPGASGTDAAVLASLTETSADAPGTDDAVVVVAAPTFAALGLPREVEAALDDMGYFTPTPVQTAVYQKVMDGKDAMVQSRTGTGKTTAFGLPIVSTVDASRRVPQALILTPTRELALQVSRELGMLAKHKGLAVETIYGGAPIGKQMNALANGVHIVAGTPGRVLDLIGRRSLDLRNVRFFVLDECDEMLSMGFLEDIEKISSYVPKDRQTLLFSATMPDEVKRYSKRQMREPEHVALSTGNISVEEIHHAYYIVSGVARARDLLRVLIKESPDSAIIFCNTRDETGMVARFLTKQGLDAEALSSDLSQSDRERVMKRMKDKNLRFLVATDVAARGIDIQELSHVINYSFPESAEVYVHRTGRTGRAGKKGTALSLIGPRELGSFWYLKLLYKIQPEERDLPPASILDGVLKTPLPRIGPPPPPDALATLRGVVSGEPTEEHLALAKRLLAETDGEKIVALLVGEKVDAVLAVKAAAKAAAETARKEREDRERAERGDRFGDRDGGDRPRFGRDREGGDRPRFGRDGGGGDRPRYGRDGGGGGDRPRYGRDGGGGDRPRYGREGGEAERPRVNREAGEAAEAARSNSEAPRVERAEVRPERDRSEAPRFERDRGERDARPERTDARPERDRGERDARPERTDARPERDRGERDARPERTDARPERTDARPERDRGERDARPERTDARPERDRGERDARPERTDARPERDRGDAPRFDRDRSDARPERTDARPERTDARPERTDARPERTDARPERTDAHPERDRGERDARPERTDARLERDRGERDARPERTDARPERTDARPERTDARPERTDRERVRDERNERFERAAERVEREERAAREAREARPVEAVVESPEREAAPARDDRPARGDRGRDDRGRDDRGRDARPARNDRPEPEARPERTEARPEAPPAADRGGRKNGSAAAEPRDFWETWADEKSSRAAEPAPAPRREEPRRDEARREEPRRDEARREEPRRDEAPARAERRPADDGPPRRERGRGRDRDRSREEPAEARPAPSRDGDAPPPAAAALVVNDPASQVRLHVNLGKKHGVSADDVRRLLGGDLGGDAASIGSVAMRDTYCHVRVPSSLAQPIIDAMNGKAHGDVTVKVELART